MEMLLTIEQTAQRLQLHPETVRRQLVRGTLRGIRRGRVWRVPESALVESIPSASADGAASRTAAVERGFGFLKGKARSSDDFLDERHAEAKAESEGVATSTPQQRAAQILAEVRSGEIRRRNAAISRLARSDAKTRAIVEGELEKSNAAYDGPEDDFSEWRALDSKPIFPEEAPDYLDGLYRVDSAEKESV